MSLLISPPFPRLERPRGTLTYCIACLSVPVFHFTHGMPTGLLFFYIPTVDTPASRIQFSSQWVIWEFNLISLAPFTINKFEWISKGMRRWNWKNWGSSWKNERENWGLVEGKKKSLTEIKQHTKSERKEMSWPRPSRWWPTISQFKVYSFSISLSFDSEQERKHREKNKTISISKLILIMNTNFSSLLFIVCHLDRKWVLSVFDLMRDDIMEWSLSICIRRRARTLNSSSRALGCEWC